MTSAILIAPEKYSFLKSGLANRRVAQRRNPASALFVVVNGALGGSLRETNLSGEKVRSGSHRCTSD
jgi:hypothetical protein